MYEWKLPTDYAPALRLIRSVVSGRVHALTFTSAPAVRNLLAIADEHSLREPLLAAMSSTVVVACVGPVCASAAIEVGIVDPVVPDKARLGPLILAMAEVLVTRSTRYRVGDHELVLRGSSVEVDGAAVPLSDRERGVVQLLATRRGAVVSKVELLRSVWGEAGGDPHVVEVTVARLRGRLGSVAPSIVAVPRRGYRLDAKEIA